MTRARGMRTREELGWRRITGSLLGGLLIVGAAMIGSAASAGGTTQDEPGFYGAARGGFNWATGQRWLGQRNGFAARDDKESGWAAGAAIGYDFVPFRIELEYLHRSNDISSLNVLNSGGLAGDLGLSSPTGPAAIVRSKTKATSVMANGLVELNRKGALRPYFGLGLGFVDVDGDAFLAAGRRILGGDDVVVGGQAIAGVALRLSRHVSADVGYRYLVTDKAQLGLGTQHLQRQRYKSHGLLFGLTWRFGGAKTTPAPSPQPVATPAGAPSAPVNHPPQALDDHFQAVAGEETEIQPLANDRDPDHSALELVSVSAPAHGTVRQVGGRLIYRSPPDFRGSERLAYRISDGHGGEDGATITIDVTAPEVGPYLVFFDFDSARIREDALPILDKAAADFRKYGFARIELVGHADRAGPDWYNDRLSLRRAEAVKSAMVTRGVPAQAIVTEGRGEHEPLVPTEDGVREPQNRRVEIGLHD